MSALLVVAHPDDETIFFGGTLLAQKNLDWHVICVTDGNGDGRGAERKVEFEKACKSLGVNTHTMLRFADDPNGRLPVTEVEHELNQHVLQKNWTKVLTHSPIGEYGHLHHQDVSYVVHKIFRDSSIRVEACAYNSFADERVLLSDEQFQKKSEILWKIYRKEIVRFLNILPNTFVEGSVKLAWEEVSTIYECLAKNQALNRAQLKKFHWLADYLEAGHLNVSLRQFLSSYLAAS